MAHIEPLMKIKSLLRRLNWQLSGLPLALKIGATVALLVSLTLMTLWFILTQHIGQLIHQQSDAFGHAMSQQMADAAAEPLLAEDSLSLKVLVNKVTNKSIITDAYILDNHHQLLAASSKHPVTYYLDKTKTPNTFNRYTVYAVPIEFQKVQAGFAYLVIDEQFIHDTLRQGLMWMLAITLGILSLSIILAGFLARHITVPIKQLKFANERIRQGDLDYRIQQTRHDEIGVLMESFNIMAEELKEKQKIRTTFDRYFDPNIANNILTNRSGVLIPTQYVKASVLFVDMVNFTTMCEQNSPETVAHLLNTYYTLIQRASSFYRGTLDKFIGDGAMILFGVPTYNARHGFHAVCCAQLILGLVEQLNQHRRTCDQPTLEFRLGLHCGSMLAGSIGGEARLQYTVVGDTVNMASRLCSEGKAGKLTISKEVFDACQGETKLITGEEHQLQLKGKALKVNAYVVHQLKAEYQIRLQHQIISISQCLIDEQAPRSRAHHEPTHA